MATATTAASSDKLNKDQKGELQKVFSFYGKAGVHNGVTVNAGAGTSGTNNGGTGTVNGKTTISLDLSHWDSKDANLNGGTAEAEKAGTVIHEGEHGVQQKAVGMPKSNQQEFSGEQQAFQVQSYVNQGWGVTSAYGVWTPTGGFNQPATDAISRQQHKSGAAAVGRRQHLRHLEGLPNEECHSP